MPAFGRAGFDAVVFNLGRGAVAVTDLPALAAIGRAPTCSSSHACLGIPRLGSGRLWTPAWPGSWCRTSSLLPRPRRSWRPPARPRSVGGALAPGHRAATREGPVLLAVLESADELELVAAVCAVEGLDGIFAGPNDLAVSLGVPGQLEHEKVLAAMADAVRRAREGGRSSAPTARSPRPRPAGATPGRISSRSPTKSRSPRPPIKPRVPRQVPAADAAPRDGPSAGPVRSRGRPHRRAERPARLDCGRDRCGRDRHCWRSR